MLRRLSVLSVLPLLLLGSCGTLKMYSGPARPASQVARLQPGGHLFRAVSIRSVDDKSLGMGNRYAEVLPGRTRSWSS